MFNLSALVFPRRCFSDCGRSARPDIRAFTLVEVAVAIGIFSFAIIAILGLLSTAFNSTRNASTQAASAAIVTTVLGELNSRNFTTNVANLPSTRYFTQGGTETNSASGLYRCTVTDVTPPTVSTSVMREVKLTICWPPPAFNQTNIVIGSFAKYD